jgi:hypothetical protein
MNLDIETESKIGIKDIHECRGNWNTEFYDGCEYRNPVDSGAKPPEIYSLIITMSDDKKWVYHFATKNCGTKLCGGNLIISYTVKYPLVKTIDAECKDNK